MRFLPFTLHLPPLRREGCVCLITEDGSASSATTSSPPPPPAFDLRIIIFTGQPSALQTVVVSALLFVLTFSALRIWAPTFASSEKFTILGGFVSSLLFFFSLLVPSPLLSIPYHSSASVAHYPYSQIIGNLKERESGWIQGATRFLSLSAHPNSHPIASCRSVCELGYRHGQCRYRPQSLRDHMVPPLRPILSLAIAHTQQMLQLPLFDGPSLLDGPGVAELPEEGA